jgi:hypothetical protein
MKASSSILTAPRLFKTLSLFQILACSALLAHYYISKPSTPSSFDAYRLYFIQIIIALVQFLPFKPQHKTYALFAYLGTSILNGIAAAILFLLAYNLVELDCINNGACNADMNSIIRTGAFLITQMLVIHPTVSYIIHIWNKQGGDRIDLTDDGFRVPLIQ